MKRFECWILCHLVLNEELRQRRLSSPRVYPKIPETGVSFMHHFRPQQPPCSQHMWWYRNKLKRTLTLACSTEKRKNYIKIQKKKKKTDHLKLSSMSSIRIYLALFSPFNPQEEKKNWKVRANIVRRNELNWMRNWMILNGREQNGSFERGTRGRRKKNCWSRHKVVVPGPSIC
jgi:hypothetical protein